MDAIVIGANRGIGLELAQQWCARGHRVEAVSHPGDATELCAAGARVSAVEVPNTGRVVALHDNLDSRNACTLSGKSACDNVAQIDAVSVANAGECFDFKAATVAGEEPEGADLMVSTFGLPPQFLSRLRL